MTINIELSLSYPEGFHEMDADELLRFFSSADNRQGIYDGDRHLLLSVAWTKPGFLNYLTDVKTILLRAESGMRRGLQGYRQTEMFRTVIAGKKGQGVRFAFTAQDTDISQIGELTVFRAGDKFYAVTSVAREDGMEESIAVLHEITQSISLQ